MSSKTLLLFRTIVMGWSTAVLAFSLIYNLAIQKQSVYDWIDQFPHLAWIGLVLYFLSSMLATQKYIRNPDHCIRVFEKDNHVVVRWLHWNYFIITLTFQTVVVIAWWSLLSRSDIADGQVRTLFLDVNLNLLGLPAIAAETALNRIPIKPSLWPIIIIIPLLYVFLVWAIHAIKPHGFPYWFLDYTDSTKIWAIWFVGFFLLFIVSFFAWYYLVKLRDWVRLMAFNPAKTGPETILVGNDVVILTSSSPTTAVAPALSAPIELVEIPDTRVLYNGQTILATTHIMMDE